MAVAEFVKSVGKDFYQQARAYHGPHGEKLSEIEFFGVEAAKSGYEPDEADLKQRHLEMCERCNIKAHEFGRVQQAMDLVRSTAAMWEVFDDAGIDPFSQYAPTVDELKGISGKSFSTGSVLNVFPIFYQSEIMEGILATPMLDTMVANTVQTNGMSADHIGFTDTALNRRTAESGEWARGVELSLSYTNAQIPLKKYQGTLKASGEALRAARLPVFAAASRRIGQQLGIDVFDFALDVLIAGDGTTLGPAAATEAADTPGTPDYDDFVDILMGFTDGYTPTDALAHANVLSNVFQVTEFKDPFAGFNMQRTGAYPSPLGWNLHRWDSLGASNYAATKLVVWQANRALVQYNWGGIEQESDRVIENDFSMNVVRLWTGFSIWDRAAARVGTSFA
jgi:hypothetical protein